MNLRSLPAIGFTNWSGTGRDNIPSPLMINGAFVSGSSMALPTMWNSRITTEARCDMSIPNTRERKIRPPHPGEMLREDFLPDYGLTASGLAEALGVSRQTINELLRGRRAVSTDMALRLSRLFGNTPEVWLNAQRAGALVGWAQAIKTEVKRIKPLNDA